MKKIIFKRIILITTLLGLLWMTFYTLRFVYVNRDFLSNDSNIDGGTNIQLRINTDFDINYIEELVQLVTQHKQDRIDVKVNPSNNSEIVINMDYTETNKIESLIDKLEREYGEDIEIPKVESIINSNNLQYRRNIFLILGIVFIIIIVLFLACISTFKKLKESMIE